jgi:hypothetical protein
VSQRFEIHPDTVARQQWLAEMLCVRCDSKPPANGENLRNGRRHTNSPMQTFSELPIGESDESANYDLHRQGGGRS